MGAWIRCSGCSVLFLDITCALNKGTHPEFGIATDCRDDGGRHGLRDCLIDDPAEDLFAEFCATHCFVAVVLIRVEGSY